MQETDKDIFEKDAKDYLPVFNRYKIVLDHGEVVERGTHAELLNRGGAYAQMWALQLEEREAEDAPA